MAKKKSLKRLDDHIADLEAAISDLHACPACGNPIRPDATTCPHCGTPITEAVELRTKADESLQDLEKHLAQTSDETTSLVARPADPPAASFASTAEVAAVVEIPPPPEAVSAAKTSAASEVSAEEEFVAEEGEESHDLEGFIEEIEAEVGPSSAPAAESTPRPVTASKPTVRAVPRSIPARGGSRWVAPIAAGIVLYVLALFLLALLGRLFVASFMIVGTLLVVAGIRARPVVSARRVGSGSRIVEDYVCPLCGTGIQAHATQCPTCGAVFEE